MTSHSLSEISLRHIWSAFLILCHTSHVLQTSHKSQIQQPTHPPTLGVGWCDYKQWGCLPLVLLYYLVVTLLLVRGIRSIFRRLLSLRRLENRLTRTRNVQRSNVKHNNRHPPWRTNRFKRCDRCVDHLSFTLRTFPPIEILRTKMMECFECNGLSCY